MDDTLNTAPIPPASEPPDDVETLKTKCEEYLAGWKRAKADYANLQKDVEKEKAELLKYANERLLLNLLPALDQFETALRFFPNVNELPEDQRQRFEKWFQGLKAVKSLWENMCAECGLEPLPEVAEFDPQLHEAIGYETSDSVPEGHILRTLHTGWKFHGKLIRPSKVVVAKSSTHEHS